MLPLRYMIAAAVAFVGAAGGVAWLAPELAGHYYQPRVLALTHAVALGWITLTIMGASYQLIPVVLEAPVWSERLARWQFVILTGGVVGMVSHFYLGQWAGLAWAATMVGLGVFLHLLNVTLTIRGLRRGTLTARLVAAAHVGLALTVVFGLALAAGRVAGVWPGGGLAWVHAHFHLALLGWVAPMLIGVAARVYPMFLLSADPAPWLGRVQLGGLGLGVPTLVAGLLAQPALIGPGALIVAAGMAGHAGSVLGIARRRKRPALDWGLRFTLTGTLFLAPATAVGLALAFGRLSGPRPTLAYAVLALGGWVSLSAVGMMLKIVPVLTWNRVYGPLVGRVPVPTLAQLSWPPAEGVAYALLTGGTLALAASVAAASSVWIRAAGVALSLGAAAFVLTLARVLSHLARRAGRGADAVAMSARTR